MDIPARETRTLTAPGMSPKTKRMAESMNDKTGSPRSRRKSWCPSDNLCRFCKDYLQGGTLRQACLHRPKELKKPRRRGEPAKRIKSLENITVMPKLQDASLQLRQESNFHPDKLKSTPSAPSSPSVNNHRKRSESKNKNVKQAPVVKPPFQLDEIPSLQKSHSFSHLNQFHSQIPFFHINSFEDSTQPPILQRSSSLQSLDDFAALEISSPSDFAFGEPFENPFCMDEAGFDPINQFDFDPIHCLDPQEPLAFDFKQDLKQEEETMEENGDSVVFEKMFTVVG